MRRNLLSIGVLVLLLGLQIEARRRNSKQYWGTSKAKKDDRGLINIDDLEYSGDDFDVGPTHEDDEDSYDDLEGSGYDVTPVDDPWSVGTDDEDLAEESGSGMPDEPEVTPEPAVDSTPSTTTKKLLSPCEQLLSTSQYALFVPKCKANGDYFIQQCHKGTKECWCVDPKGKEIEGTRRAPPHALNCTTGQNLTQCILKRVKDMQVKTPLLGHFTPKCSDKGGYEKMQCHEGQCWCVDETGNEILGSVRHVPDMPQCEEKETEKPEMKTTQKPHEKPDVYLPDGKGYDVTDDDESEEEPTDIDNVIIADKDDINIDSDDSMEEIEEQTNEINNEAGIKMTRQEEGDVLLSSPGLLAGIIGGAVVGLLCMVLLVMFIVYRMRKKDEGSYPLDEQKYQNYSYNKAPDKEFYA